MPPKTVYLLLAGGLIVALAYSPIGRVLADRLLPTEADGGPVSGETGVPPQPKPEDSPEPVTWGDPENPDLEARYVALRDDYDSAWAAGPEGQAWVTMEYRALAELGHPTAVFGSADWMLRRVNDGKYWNKSEGEEIAIKKGGDYSLKRAHDLFQEYLDSGDPEWRIGVLRRLGDMHALGFGGLIKSELTAFDFYRRAMLLGNELAAWRLAKFWEKGTLVGQDRTIAYALLLYAQSGALENTWLGGDHFNLAQDIKIQEIYLSEGERLAGQGIAKDLKRRIEGGLLPPMVDDGSKSDEIGLMSLGSGFLVAPNLVVTAYHVVADVDDMEVVAEGRTIAAKIAASDADLDLAILVLDSSVAESSSFRTIREPKLGEPVFTIGFPNTHIQGNAPKYTEGSVSSIEGIQGDPEQFQISTPIQPGNSGGALLSKQGDLLGIVVSILDPLTTLRATGALPNSVGYAVRASHVTALLEENGLDVDESQIADGASDWIALAEDAAVLVVGRPQ